MSTTPVVAIDKPEVLDSHRILENDIDNFTANHEARAVLLQRALDNSGFGADRAREEARRRRS